MIENNKNISLKNKIEEVLISDTNSKNFEGISNLEEIENAMYMMLENDYTEYELNQMLSFKKITYYAKIIEITNEKVVILESGDKEIEVKLYIFEPEELKKNRTVVLESSSIRFSEQEGLEVKKSSIIKYFK